MNNNMLCTLLAEKIDPTKFQIRGTEVHWLLEPTTEEQVIIENVIANYDTLAAEYQMKQMQSQAENLIQSILDSKAKEYGHDTIHTALTWRNSKDEIIKANALALEDWADDVWIFARNELALQEAGTPTYFTIEEFIAALPKFE
jgi:hypothetical protein